MTPFEYGLRLFLEGLHNLDLDSDRIKESLLTIGKEIDKKLNQ